MKQDHRVEIIRLWKDHGESYTAPDAISYKTGIGRGRIKAIIDTHTLAALARDYRAAHPKMTE